MNLSVRHLVIAATLSTTWATAALVSPVLAEQAIDFNRDILPILSDKCFACHGPDRRSEESRSTNLRLDERASATKIEAIVPGDSDASELIARITTTDDALRMPPSDSNKAPLGGVQIELLRQWIDQGAKYDMLWSLVPPRRPDTPAVENTSWPLVTLDHFVLARLEAVGMQSSPAADRTTLIRRVTLDLTGLPPTPEEVKRFVEDPDSTQQALERVVDRLLASPAYGEHMAAEWLQLARFADSNGYQNDFRREMWIWRDWVIDAFNSNMPYDQFAIEQMAGDLLTSPTQSQLIATGFHRNNRTVTEAGSIDEEWRVENNIDRVETTGTVFLGLTMGCARCHDHKYDPISQEEFYEFYAFFNSIDEKGVYVEQRGNVPPLLQVPSQTQQGQLADLNARIEKAKRRVAEITESEVLATREWLQHASIDGTPPTPGWSLPLNGSLKVADSQDDSFDHVVISSGAQMQTWEESLTGQALQFSGNAASHLQIIDHRSRDRDTPFAFSIWLRPEQGDSAILSQMDDADSYRGWDTILLSDLRVKVHFIHRWDGDAIAVITREAVPANEWTHLAVSYRGNGRAAGVQVFINGKPAELEVEHDNLTHSFASDEPLRLGRRSTGLDFKGAMASLHLFGQTLDESAVSNLIASDLIQLGGNDVDTWSSRRQALLRSFALRDRAGSVSTASIELTELEEQRKQLYEQIPTVMILRNQPSPRPTYLLQRGAYDAPDETKELHPDVPDMLPPLPMKEGRDRLALARWLTDRNHPLFARVQVNRVWQQLFGRGIVATPDNFGVQGDPPSHPELLDWLTVEFIESGWDIKALLRQIVLSATYQQLSNVPASAYEHDPDNRLLGRGARYRLSAEAIRDNALALSGLLTTRVGGPSVKPFQPDGLWEELAGGAGEGPYVQSEGKDLYRRSLYTNRKRTVPHPTLSTFDAPSFEICQAKRLATNTPLQALALLNDRTYLEAAHGLAIRMLEEAQGNTEDRLAHGFMLATGRRPSDEELAVLMLSHKRHESHYRTNMEETTRLLAYVELPGAKSNEAAHQVTAHQDKAQLAALTIVASELLNLDETVTHQ